MNIGMIGNWSVPFTTEHDRKWSFEKLGHKVITFQENKTTANQIKSLFPVLDVLIYSHTHGWEVEGLIDLFKEAKINKIPTVSIHLDRWAWLERVKDVGQEATWFTEYIFMADGSPEAVELYEKHKLNWYWLKPGVVERDCYIAEPDYKKYPHEIIFTGSRGYHPEYPFRHELVDFLYKTYGDRFGHYGNDGIEVVRMDELNTLYASAKVVVGDSCFGGRPRYVSDRYYEVRGRGGLLIHPHVEGIETNGVIDYEHGNFQILEYTINTVLAIPALADATRKEGHEWVKNNETYTHRANQIIEVVGL